MVWSAYPVIVDLERDVLRLRLKTFLCRMIITTENAFRRSGIRKCGEVAYGNKMVPPRNLMFGLLCFSDHVTVNPWCHGGYQAEYF